MSMSPEQIQVGDCYLLADTRLRRVSRIMPDDRVRYAPRHPAHQSVETWDAGPIAFTLLERKAPVTER